MAERPSGKKLTAKLAVTCGTVLHIIPKAKLSKNAFPENDLQKGLLLIISRHFFSFGIHVRIYQQISILKPHISKQVQFVQ